MERLFREEPVLDGRAVQRFGNIGRDTGRLTILDVFNLVVAPVSHDIDMINTQGFPRGIGRLGQ